MSILASKQSYDGHPVIIEDSERFPFAPGERERDWREATDEEYQEYLDFHNAQYDAENTPN